METTHYPTTDLADVPPGWSYNPSKRSQRHPLTAVAVVGLLTALYLGSYQLHFIHRLWDPFFGSASSERILNSSIARELPIPDALLGAFAYLLEILGSALGGEKRWRTAPWLVISFGVLVGLMGLTSLCLIIAQPVFFHAWCTLCLLSAALSIGIVIPAMDELMASLHYLQRVKKRGTPFWKTFWSNN